MARSAITAAQLRVAQSRRELGSGLRRLGATLSRPSSLVAAAAVGAVLGFSLARLGSAGALVRGLGAAVLRHGMASYVRQRTVQAGTPAEHGAHG
jgi:hypothetical protein